MSSYGAKSATGPWTVSIRLSREPRCPGCCEWLQPEVIEFRNGWAWCALCVNQGLPSENHIAYVMETDAIQEHSVIVKGLRFYTPRVTMGTAKNALAYYETSHVGNADVACGSSDKKTGVSPPDGELLPLRHLR